MDGVHTNKFLVDLKPTVDAVKRRVDNLNTNLSSSGCPPLVDRSINTIEGYFRQNPQGFGLLTDVEEAIVGALIVVREFEKFRSDQLGSWKSEQFKVEQLNATLIAHERAKRKAERRDMWTLWFQQTLRWVAGAALVLLMYSSAVWLSHQNDFFKVPIKDLFPKAAEQPKA